MQTDGPSHSTLPVGGLFGPNAIGAAAIAAARLATGKAAPDEHSEATVTAIAPGMLLPLRAMRMAALLLPVAALTLAGIHLLNRSLFAFSRSDLIMLAVFVLAGLAVATTCYLRPRFTAHAFVALWQLRLSALSIYLVLMFVPAALFSSVFLSRTFLGILVLPVVAATWTMYREFSEANRLARAFPLVFAIMAAVPGFILPPYYQGICGWTIAVEVGDTVTLTGYQLVNDEDERIWLTHTLFTPVTQVGRFQSAWSDKSDLIGPIEPFLLKAYTRAYPLLKESYMPFQRHLGRFAYPPSTYATNLPNHSEFPPARIKRIQLVEQTYDLSDNLVDTKVYRDYEIP